MNLTGQNLRLALLTSLVGAVLLAYLHPAWVHAETPAPAPAPAKDGAVSESAPRWRMRSSSGAETTPSSGPPKWRMSSVQAASATASVESAPAASATSGASSYHDFFQRAGEVLYRDHPASTARPSHGEAEFGRFQIPAGAFGGAESAPSAALESATIDDSAESGDASVVAPPRAVRPRPLWQPSFVETLVPTRRNRSSSPNAWSYPEGGSYGEDVARYDSGSALESRQFEGNASDGILVSDDAPHVYSESESYTPPSAREPWFVFGRGEEYRQNPWLARYPSNRFRGPTIPSRFGSVMGEVRHMQPTSVRSLGFYDVRNPAGPYVYEYENIDDPFEDWEEVEALGETRFHLRAGIPPLRQWYDPNMAHFKAGPLYLEALWAETGFLYSDFRGTTQFPSGQEDGWLGYASFAMRGAARLFKDVFLVLNGEVIYLIGENKVGLRALESVGGPSAIAQLDYYGEWGEWDVHIFDRLGTGQFFNVDFLLEDAAFERAGRYVLGYPGNARSRDFLLYDPVVYNQIGIQGQRPVGDLWQTQLSYVHSDFYYPEWEGSHRHMESIEASFGAAPGKIPFSPTLSYYGISPDHFDSMAHALYLSGNGALTDRLNLTARGGYLWNELANNNFQGDHWLWSVGLRHRISSRSFHHVTVGQDFFWRDFTDDAAVSDFVQYGFNHRFSDRLLFAAFVQWSSDEYLIGEFSSRDFDTTVFGARIDFQVIDDIFLYLGYRFEDVDEARNTFESDRHIFNATAYLRLTERSVSYVGYQFEKFDSNASFFDEHLWQAGVRRYF
jgi:hypothetical protein